MKKSTTKEILDLIRSMQNIDYIDPDEIPNIDLYMDQVTTFMDKHLQSSKRFEDDKILTKTMINNYTKNNLLPPPDKKKYSREHMLLLIFIYYFKTFLSISDIKSILSPLTDNYFKQADAGQLSFADIYATIFNDQKEEINETARDIISKLRKSQKTFPEIEDEEEKELLSTFAFICMLSFDVWIKKTIIENLIDETLSKQADESADKAMAPGKEKE